MLTYIFKNPKSTVREIASAIGITERLTHNIISDLVTDGYLQRQKVGRKNVYHVNRDIGLRHPIVKFVHVRDLLKVLAKSQPSDTPDESQLNYYRYVEGLPSE